jgi:hypothetical protein
MKILKLLALLPLFTYGIGYFPQDLANPLQYPSACGRSEVEKSVICDPDLIMSTYSKNIIESMKLK